MVNWETDTDDADFHLCDAEGGLRFEQRRFDVMADGACDPGGVSGR